MSVARKVAHALLAGRDGLTVLPILRGPARGLRLAIDLRIGGEAAHILGRYERPLLQRLQQLINPGMCVWDCGAYIGALTVFCARAAGPLGKVIAFEPHPTFRERIRRNQALNDLHNIIVSDAAIAGAASRVELVLEATSTSRVAGAYVGAAKTEGDTGQRVVVNAVSLDRALDSYPAPAILKIDIEGGEVEALRHADVMLSEVRPTIVIEHHNPDAQRLTYAITQRFSYVIENVETGHICDRVEDVPHHAVLRPR